MWLSWFRKLPRKPTSGKSRPPRRPRCPLGVETLEDRTVPSFVTAPPNFAVGSIPHGEAVGDFNGDGKADLAVVNEGANTVSILLGNGDGSFRTKADFATGTQPWGLAVGDFNGDGKLDLAVANRGANSVSIL